MQNMLGFVRGREVGMGVLVGWVIYVSAVVGFNVVKSVVQSRPIRDDQIM